MRPYSICCKPQLDVFEERKVEGVSAVETPQTSVHFHACSFLLSGVDVVHREIPDFQQDERGMTWKLFGPEIESAPRVKLAVASRWGSIGV